MRSDLGRPAPEIGEAARPDEVPQVVAGHTTAREEEHGPGIELFLEDAQHSGQHEHEPQVTAGTAQGLAVTPGPGPVQEGQERDEAEIRGCHPERRYARSHAESLGAAREGPCEQDDQEAGAREDECLGQNAPEGLARRERKKGRPQKGEDTIHTEAAEQQE